MKLKVLKYPNEVLRRKSIPINAVTEDIKKLASDMAETMYAEDGIGLAAPQVGENIRLIVIDISGPEKQENLISLINPVITPYVDSGIAECEEGCLSIPEFRSKVRRPAKIHVSAIGLDNQKIDFDAEGILSTCVQHETDHLDGKLFVDHMSYLKRTLFEKKWARQGRN